MKKRMSYRDALALRGRPPLPPHHKLRVVGKPRGSLELLPVAGVYRNP